MRKSTMHIVAAVSIFLLVGAVSLIYLSDRSGFPKQNAAGTQDQQELQLSIPENIWVQIFFKEIDERVKKAKLTNLRTNRVPDGDIEVRLWKIAGHFGIDGIILRRSGNQWSGTYLHGFSRDPNVNPSYEEPLPAPRSGWEATWERLVSSGILSQRDASELGCNVFGLDGLGYVVETNMNGTYRTYMYDNPVYAECIEAKEMIAIIRIIDEEFNLRWAG